MMPGMPLAANVTRFHVAAQCLCGWSMYIGKAEDDFCKPGQMTCTNSDCREFGVAYEAQVIDSKRAQ